MGFDTPKTQALNRGEPTHFAVIYGTLVRTFKQKFKLNQT